MNKEKYLYRDVVYKAKMYTVVYAIIGNIIAVYSVYAQNDRAMRNKIFDLHNGMKNVIHDATEKQWSKIYNLDRYITKRIAEL